MASMVDEFVAEVFEPGRRRCRKVPPHPSATLGK
jgi:hypothetical protein